MRSVSRWHSRHRMAPVADRSLHLLLVNSARCSMFLKWDMKSLGVSNFSLYLLPIIPQPVDVAQEVDPVLHACGCDLLRQPIRKGKVLNCNGF